MTLDTVPGRYHRYTRFYLELKVLTTGSCGDLLMLLMITHSNSLLTEINLC